MCRGGGGGDGDGGENQLETLRSRAMAWCLFSLCLVSFNVLLVVIRVCMCKCF